MNSISNRFFVTAVSDGTTISAVLRSDEALSQIYSLEAGSAVPNWNDPQNQPTVYAVVRANGVYRTPTGAVSWMYNGVAIEFDEDGRSTNFMDGDSAVFLKTTRVVDGFTMPALKILRNLAGLGNTDMDTITLNNSVEAAGSQIPYSVSVPVRISQMSTSGYFGYVDGDSYITSSVSGESGYTAVMSACLYNGTEQVTDFSTNWYREGIDPAGSPFAQVQASAQTSKVATATLNADQVADYVVVRVEFYKGNEKVFTAFWDVDDMKDMEEMYITHGANNQNNASLRKGESCVFKIWMGRRTNQYQVDARFTSFRCKLLDSEGHTITTGLPSTPDANGYFDITVHDMEIQAATSASSAIVAAKGGQITISYDFANTHGSSITGIIVAESS